MIDIHMHIGRLYIGEKPLTPSYLLRFMDKNRIERAVLLPIESPEEAHYYITTEYVVKVCKRHPERFIPFCNVDPKIAGADNSTQIYARLKEYQEQGCKGFGEAMSGLYIDDPRLQRIYKACGKLDLPIIFHIDRLRNIDEKGFPRFEKMIKKFPETVFIGHGQHFWAEISSDTTKEDFCSYPKGRIKSGGAIIKLLSRYPNLYADLSAGSGFNALTRDPAYGYRFLEKFQDKIIFGTDICRFNQEAPLIFYLKKILTEGKISKMAYNKITQKNAKKILN